MRKNINRMIVFATIVLGVIFAAIVDGLSVEQIMVSCMFFGILGFRCYNIFRNMESDEEVYEFFFLNKSMIEGE